MSEPLSTQPSGPGPTGSGRPAWVSAAEAGRLCGVTERTVRRWVTTGRLPADMSGPTVRIAVADLQPYIAAATATQPDVGQAPRPASGRVTVLRPDSSPDTDPSGLPPSVRTDSPPDSPDADRTRPDPPRAVVDLLTAQVRDLQATIAEQRVELEARRREVQELHVLLQRAQQLALPAPRDTDLASRDARSPAPGTTSGDVVSRPWWRTWWPWGRL
jgi:excisionase family DNA binding protein